MATSPANEEVRGSRQWAELRKEQQGILATQQAVRRLEVVPEFVVAGEEGFLPPPS
jgi:hypothetical protein